MEREVDLDQARKDGDPGFRRARARLAAYAMHERHPDVAKDAGRRGGEATSGRFALGKSAWGVAMAMRRWHGTPLPQIRSRAPTAEPDDDELGTSESGSAAARSRSERSRER
jgi:general stress protein YciG